MSNPRRATGDQKPDRGRGNQAERAARGRAEEKPELEVESGRPME